MVRIWRQVRWSGGEASAGGLGMESLRSWSTCKYRTWNLGPGNHATLQVTLQCQVKTTMLVATRYAPAPLLPRGRPSASRPAEQTQRSSSFPRPIRYHGHRCTLPHALRPRWVQRPGDLDLWPFDPGSGVRVACDVGYLCASFSLPMPLCSRLRPDVRDMQTDVRRLGGGGIIKYGTWRRSVVNKHVVYTAPITN